MGGLAYSYVVMNRLLIDYLELWSCYAGIENHGYLVQKLKIPGYIFIILNKIPVKI